MISWLTSLPAVLIYVVLAGGAALENIVPPVPADTFVLLGAFLAERGRADIVTVFLATWGANVATASVVYVLARRWGKGFFEHGAGRFLLRPHQLDQIARFYERFGIAAIFVSRFLPAFRALVPVFAGVTRVTWPRVIPPMAVASAAWYGMLVWLGSEASRNWGVITALFGRISGWLAALAGVLGILFVVWWWRSRHSEP